MIRLCTCPGGVASKLELSRKRKQPPNASCKACGGRASVDGIVVPVSASMLGTIGLGPADFINPKLRWKTVRKERRSRKPATGRRLNMGAKLGNRSPKRVTESSVSESEKLGVAVLGQRFSDKTDPVPIKKRRFMLQSPSSPPRTPSPHPEESLLPQPQTPSPHPEDSENFLDRKCASVNFGHDTDDGIMNDEISEGKNERLCYMEDFSGISLLAAAAYICSVGNDADNANADPVVEEGFGSSTSNMSFKETTASTGAGNYFQTDLIQEENMDGSSVRHSSAAVLQNLNNNREDGAGRRPVPSKDDRLHWDLNTVMDAWEQPHDDSFVDFQRDISQDVSDMQREKLENLESFETQMESEDIQSDMESEVQSRICRMVSTDAHKHQMLLDLKQTDPESSKLSTEEHKLEASTVSGQTCNDEKYVSTSNGHVLEPLNSMGADTKASRRVVNMDASLNYSFFSESHLISTKCISDEKMSVASSSAAIVQNSEHRYRTSEMQLDRTISFGIVQVGKHDVLPNVAVSEKGVRHTSIQTEDDEGFGKTSGSPDNKVFQEEMISPVVCKVVNVESSLSNFDKVDLSHPPPKCEESCASGTSLTVGEGQSDVICGKKEFISKTCDHPVSDGRAQGAFILQDSCISYSEDTKSLSCKTVLPFNGKNFDVSEDIHAHLVGVKNTSGRQAGYDSPIEDGELRESVVYSWEENEVEDGETECVDYESDGVHGADFDPDDHLTSEKVEVGCEGSHIVEKGIALAIKVTEANFCKSGSVKTSSSGIAVEQSADMTMEVNDNSTRKRHTPNHVDRLDVRGSCAGEIGSRVSSLNVLSLIEEASSLDVLDRKDTMFIQRSRSHNLGGSNSRARRNFSSAESMGRDRSSLQVLERNEGNGPWVDSPVRCWDSRDRYPSGYDGPEGHRYTRPRSMIPNSVAKVGGMNSHDHRHSINYPSRGMYRPTMRRSPVDRDDSYDVHRGLPPVRGISRDRSSRGRYGMYPQGIGRGPEEEFRELVPDGYDATSVRMPHYLSRRERSFSPTFSRGARISRLHGRSRSRSRSRSPPAWFLQKGRDLRSEARMERMRMPFRRPSFAADYEENLMSPPRSRFPSQRNSRWVDDDDHFRDRRSPVRTFRWSQRFNSACSSGRLESDDYFRPMIRSGRFPTGDGRGRTYDGDDDRRKHDRYEMNRVRSGGFRRFEYDADDRLEASYSHIEDDRVVGTNPRDVQRSAREGRGSLRYSNNDRMCTTPRRDYAED